MPFFRHAVQRIGDAGLDASRIIVRQPQSARDLIGRLEANAVDILHQTIGCILYDSQRIVAILLINLDRQRRRHAVRLQKNHHVLNGPLFMPRFLDAAHPLGTNTQDFAQPLRFVVDDVQRLLAKLLHDPFGHHRSHAADHARAQIALDAFDRRRQRLLAHLCLKLAPILSMYHPSPAHAQPLAGIDLRQVSHNGDQRVAPRGILEGQHAALVGI